MRRCDAWFRTRAWMSVTYRTVGDRMKLRNMNVRPGRVGQKSQAAGADTLLARYAARRGGLRHSGAQASDLDFGRQPILILMARLKVTFLGQVIGGYCNELAALLVCERFDNFRDHSGHSTCNNLRLRVWSDLMS